MSTKRMVIVIIPMLCLMAAGCAKSTVRVRQDDGTYRTSTHLVFQPDFADRTFSSGSDYMVSTEFYRVTYVWPQGKGNLSKQFNEITFKGKSVNCTIVKRRLTINGRRIAEFEEGDRVRITGDGKVFVNGVELKQQ
ncbi:MAG: hypothetical protein ACYSUX_02900 [Planctomycetota bacterium]